MTIEVGKRYSCSGYFLLLYPDKDTAAACPGSTAIDAAAPGDAARTAAYWTRELGKPVSYCNPKTPLLVLSVDKKYVEVLAGDRKGWIINEDWFELKKIR
jgi:hypothetical protein